MLVPAHTYVSDAVFDALVEYVDSGGHLFVGAEALSQDGYGRARPLTPLIEQPDWPQTELDRPVGEGHLQTTTAPLDEMGYRAVVETMSERAGVTRPFRVRNAKGEPIAGVLGRGARIDGQFAITLVNYNQNPLSVRVTGKESAIWRDVLNNENLEEIITLGSLEPRLIIER